MLIRVSYADIDGTKYSNGDILVCTYCDHDPVFGKVLDVIITESNECLFVLEPFIVRAFSHHFNAYEVEQITNEYIVCRHKDFVDHHPLSISKSFNYSFCDKSFVCFKYNVYSM